MPSPSPGSGLKRARSDTAGSGTTSPKRSNSEAEVGQDIADGGRQVPDVGIDEYMRLQDGNQEEDIGLASIPALENGDHLTGPEQFQMVTNLSKMPLEPGTTWYLVATNWVRKWEAATGAVPSKDYAGITISSLGPVDNSSIVHPGSQRLLPDLDLNVDYQIIPDAAWHKLVQWYGQPQICLPREVITYSNETRVEVYQPIFRVYPLLPSALTPSQVEISSLEKLSTLAAKAAANIQLADPTYRVWNLPATTNVENGIHPRNIERGSLLLIPSDSKTPISEFTPIAYPSPPEHNSDDELGQDDASDLGPLFRQGTDYFSTLEKKLETSPKANKSTAVTAPSAMSTLKNTFTSTFRGKSPAPAVQRGTMGLQNLGNTCFMNSALQCLVHIPELEEYFLSGLYKHELNYDNPLGMQGQIANVFGALLHHLYPSPNSSPEPATRSYGWGNSANSYAPREFKLTLGKFAPAFSGYQQHDTQEFLGFLLDGLHEDLNRVLKKPYVEKPDWPDEGGDERAAAKETWEGYKKRNDSIIVDLFQGMYKSTLVCPECNKVSITFDPFMYLTLPLPVTKTWRHVVHYVPWDIRKTPLAVEIEVPKDSSYGYLKKLFGRWFGVEPENLLAAEVWSHKFYKFYDDYMNLTELAEKDTLVLYELPIPLKSIAKSPPASTGFSFGTKPKPPPKSDPNAPFLLPVFHFSEAQRNAAFGVPFFVLLTPAEASTREGIYRAVVERCQRWTKCRGDLWRYRGLRVPSPTEDEDAEGEVVENIEPETVEPDGAVTEIRPDADEMKVEVVRDVEMEPVKDSPTKEAEASETILENGQGASPARPEDEDEPFEIIGPQTELFDLRLFNSVTMSGIETGFNMNASSVRWVDWNSREHMVRPDPTLSDPESEDGNVPVDDKVPAPTPLVKPNDALVCVWSHIMQSHFFGPDSSLFDWWEEFVHPEVQAARDAQTKSRSGKRSIDIEDCLDEFTKEEQLGEEDLWYCPRCKKHQQATKKFELWSVPDILVVHLKRFSNARAMRDKIDALIEFPITGLDLNARVGEGGETGGCVYDLFAVDEHMGGLGGGHYRAYAKNPSDNEWYHFDDSYVTKSTAEDSVNSNAYLLFYRRRASNPKSVVEKVRARIVSNPESESQKSVDMVDKPVVRAPDDETEPPPFELSGLDPVVPNSAYDLSGTQSTYDIPGPYRSTTGGSDDDPSFTSPSPATSASIAAEYDSAEEKDLEGVDTPGGVTIEISTTKSVHNDIS
ncbi:hypothetical protein OPQ81_002539 [Rhizoctonia solani]|nr:hypothetical protein OPQ81_002539 [Rhizoctonia solani]